MATVSDKLVPVIFPLETEDNYYRADISSTSNYYPFGLVSEFSNMSKYRYGFNGKEYDDAFTFYEGAVYDYGFRIYDARIGKFLSVDPLTATYPWYTPYQFAGNKPINSIDIDGLEESASFYAEYNDPLLMGKTTGALWHNAVDGFGNAGLISLEYSAIGFTGYEGALVRLHYRNVHGIEFPENISNYDLQRAFDLRKVDRELVFVPERGITGDMIDFFFGALDVAAIVPATNEVATLAKCPLSSKLLSQAAKGGGEFVIRKFKELDKMSKKAWFKYQQQINGFSDVDNIPGLMEYRIIHNGNNVDFDGYLDGTLLEAKGFYQWVFRFVPEEKIYKRMANQFQRQVAAANGKALNWHFAENSTMSQFKTFLNDNGIQIPENVNFVNTKYNQ